MATEGMAWGPNAWLSRSMYPAVITTGACVYGRDESTTHLFVGHQNTQVEATSQWRAVLMMCSL